jgi:uncharacterized damage-inducible protein DinB
MVDSVMNELTRIEEQVRRAFEGESWHGPAVLETLVGVSADAATARPIADAHSIWEVVLHIAATYRLVLQRTEGRSVNLSAEEDWPRLSAPAGDEAWREAVEELCRLNREVRRAIIRFDAHRLDQMLAPGHSSAYMHFAGLPQHDAYHAGQIMLLRKTLGSTSR